MKQENSPCAIQRPNLYLPNMKIIQALYVVSALALSVVILGVSCFQFSSPSVAMESPFEEPIDEDAKDISDDFADDKEYTHHPYQPSNHAVTVLHSAGYLISHASQVREISTPPPKSFSHFG
jgi:hypothetical protein